MISYRTPPWGLSSVSVRLEVEFTLEYPLAMSTSMGTWPRASSKGDKTIIDPWPNTFDKVRFWKYIGASYSQ